MRIGRCLSLMVLCLAMLAAPAMAKSKLLEKFSLVEKKFERTYFVMADKAVAGCGSNASCKRDVSRFLKFVWDNKDKRNMKLLVAKCAVKMAVKKGFNRRPGKVFANLTPVSSRKAMGEMCLCTMGDWASKQCDMLR